jgi:NADH dehydrogenase [ubiquinone] 1 alpha subcomplex assembly factor 1
MKNTYKAYWCLLLVGLFTGSAVAEQKKMEIFSFEPEADISVWEVEDDGVMGGVSQGSLTVNDEGHGVFSGIVSLDNNGGFSSIQYYFDPVDVAGYETAYMCVKGDGRRYLFLVEATARARHYYVGEFQTSGEWETVGVPLGDMVPVWRGDRLDLPNFPRETLAQVRIMIANQVREEFALEIDRIWLE